MKREVEMITSTYLWGVALVSIQELIGISLGSILDILDIISGMILESPSLLLRLVLFNLKPLTQIIVIPGLAFILLFAIIVVWFERKFLARAMLRVGPYYCGGRSGVLQLIADFLKLFLKEIVIPKDAHRALFVSMPVILPTIPALAITLIPFDLDWVLFRAGGLSLPMFFAIAGFSPLIPVFAGWAANNKYTIIGSLRTAFLYISAEIPLVLCAAAVAIMAGSFDLVRIVEAQSTIWFSVPQFIGFIIFFLGLIIEAERTPFDIPTAEVELVLGWRTEFSGILFGFTMMAEYVSFLAWALLFITLYLGGYNGPNIFGLPLYSHIFWILFKLAILVPIVILIRGVFPRFRMDQLLRLGWYYLMPLSILNLFITLALKLGGIF
ncbi:MAG: NADH-quinone oxidoreductase subunit NuoH [Candidatus Bathyarchaeia archaeon]|nr:NADH-quinone oxidoreductase subunit NuoH [Candidatus Bathyarchaeota archaeon]